MDKSQPGRGGVCLALMILALVATAGLLSACQIGEVSPPAADDGSLTPDATTGAATLEPLVPSSTLLPATTVLSPPLTAPATVTPAVSSAPMSTATFTSEPPAVSPTLPAQPAIVGQFLVGDLAASARHPVALGLLGGQVYVVSRGDDCVAIIENDRVVGVIPVGEDLGALVVHPESGQIFVAGETRNALYVIRGGGVVDTWMLRDRPISLAIAAESLYVALDNGQGIDVLDVQTGESRDALAVAGFYGSMSMVADTSNQLLYISGYQQVAIIDLRTRQSTTNTSYQNYLTLAVDAVRGRWYTNDYDSETNTQWLVAVDALSGGEIGRASLGGDPRQAVVHPDTGRVYVINSWSNSISVIDGEDMSPIATVPVGRRPASLALDLARNRLLVPNSESHNIVALGLDDHRIQAVVPLAILPSDLEFDSIRGYLYVSAPSANAIYVLREGVLVHQLSAGLEPIDMAQDVAGGSLYVAGYVSEDLSVVKPDAWTVETAPLVEAPMAVALDSAHRRVYAGREVLAVDSLARLQGYELHGMTLGSSVEPVEVAVDSVSNRLFAVAFNGVPGSNGANVVYVLDTETSEQLEASVSGLGVSAILLDREGRRLYSTAGRYGAFRLYVDNVESLKPIADRPLPALPVDLAYVPVSHHLYVAYGDAFGDGPPQWGVSVIDTRTLGEVAYWPLADAPNRVVSDPLTGRVYVSVGGVGKILVVQDVPLPAPPAPTPTVTPSPWPTWTPAATIQSVSRPSPTPCGSMLNAFAPYWSSEIQEALGCPTAPEVETDLAEQSFERGRMFWIGSQGRIHLLLSDGRYFWRGDAWVGPAEYACSAAPPAGLVQPKRGFGLIWCSESGLRDLIGWGLEDEWGYQTLYQPFEHGLMLLAEGGIAYALSDAGAWRSIGLTQ